jgi:hypothetical protein
MDVKSGGDEDELWNEERVTEVKSALIPPAQLGNRRVEARNRTLCGSPSIRQRLRQTPAGPKSKPPTPRVRKGVDMRPIFGAPYDQGKLRSCTANAIAAAYRILSPDKSFQPSRLYIYAKERLMQAPYKPLADMGSDAALGLAWVQEHGVPDETEWPYDVHNVNVVPPSTCDASAKLHRLSGVVDLAANVEAGPEGSNGPELFEAILDTLDAQQPVLVAVTLYESFLTKSTAKTGVIPMPNASLEKLEGGHELLIIGYQPQTARFIVANWWGGHWGLGGFCLMPFDYFRNSDLAFEFLTFSKVINEPSPPSSAANSPHVGNGVVATARPASPKVVAVVAAAAAAAAVPSPRKPLEPSSRNRKEDVVVSVGGGGGGSCDSPRVPLRLPTAPSVKGPPPAGATVRALTRLMREFRVDGTGSPKTPPTPPKTHDSL